MAPGRAEIGVKRARGCGITVDMDYGNGGRRDRGTWRSGEQIKLRVGLVIICALGWPRVVGDFLCVRNSVGLVFPGTRMCTIQHCTVTRRAN